MNKYFFTALGGAFGAVLRVFLLQFMGNVFSGFSFPSLLANTSGCFLAGLLFSLIQKYPNLYPLFFQTFLLTGVLGALTTFSGFTVEIQTLLNTGKYLNNIFWTLGIVGICIAFCTLGWFLGEKIFTW